ncbi:MAG: Periplasmic serine endoprotease DegP precursor [Candidatus Hydrogenedentes bacterium ADurb.Bin101]|nr:MAG: Periplasmic serine endoprotease DegP precursor [Candidatus Hydrogenedentes bacterium ADurb.Bin101]
MEAKVVGTDPDTDIAVLKLEPGGALSSVKLGKSSALESGQMVLAMGSPHGLARSVSLGIVSVTNRYLGDSTGAVGQYNNWIQTDAAINRGNSGGPLVNLEGEVVGINTLTLMGAENLGFAIPMDSAREVIDAIIKDGRVRRSSLGLRLQEMKAKTDNPSLQGVVIADVVPLSSGQEADIRPGDVLTAVNGKPVNARFEEDLSSVRKTIADLPVGEKTVLTLLRGDEQLEVAAVTEEQFSSKGMQAEFLEWGFTVAELTPELARRAQLAGKTGVLVSGCLPGAVASVSGLTPGDIILELDKTAIVSLSQFSQLYAACVEQKKDLVMLFVQRGALTRYVLINSKGISETTIDKEILEHAE